MSPSRRVTVAEASHEEQHTEGRSGGPGAEWGCSELRGSCGHRWSRRDAGENAQAAVRRSRHRSAPCAPPAGAGPVRLGPGRGRAQVPPAVAVGLTDPRPPRPPQRFAAVIMRIREPRTTALIFSSGKMVCTGAKRWVRAAAVVGVAGAFREAGPVRQCGCSRSLWSALTLLSCKRGGVRSHVLCV